MRKWAYVYQNSLNEPSANLKQTLLMTTALSSVVELTWFTTPFKKSRFQKILSTFSIGQPSHQKSIGPELKTKTFLSELITRYRWNANVLQTINREGFEYVYTRDFGFLFYLWLAYRGAKKPAFYLIYEPHKVYHKTSGKVPRWIEAKALSCVDFFTPISSGIWEDLQSSFKFDPARAIILPDGVRHSRDLPYQVCSEVCQLLYTGSFKSWKGIHFVLEALEQWNDRIHWHLNICGGSQEEIEILQKKVTLSGLKDKVTFKGFLDQEGIEKEYTDTQIALLPNTKDLISARYTSPLKLFEYLGAGLPILASDLPSLREILNEENACFFEAESKTGFLEALDEQIRNESMRSSQSGKNKALAQQFTWEERAKKVANLVKTLS